MVMSDRGASRSCVQDADQRLPDANPRFRRSVGIPLAEQPHQRANRNRRKHRRCLRFRKLHHAAATRTDSNPSPWQTGTGVITNSATGPSHSGSYYAWLDGYGASRTDTLYQQVAIPSTVTTATLSFWLHIDSSETTTTTKNDTLQVQIRSSSGTVLVTLATYSNLNKAAGFSQVSFNLASYKGQTIQFYLVGKEKNTKATSFLVDDFALVTQ